MTRHRSDRPETILAFIYRYHAANGLTPSLREIGAAVGLASTSAVKHHLATLVERGALRHTYGGRYALSPDRASVYTPERIEMAWCLATHGTRPPKVRPCRRHRPMAEWLVNWVLPRAAALP